MVALMLVLLAKDGRPDEAHIDDDDADDAAHDAVEPEPAANTKH